MTQRDDSLDSPPERKRRSRVVRIDREEINELAGVEFDYDEIAELADLAATYVGRFSEETPPDWMILSIERDLKPDPRKLERDARRAFVEAVEGVWRERRRRRGYGSSYRHAAETHEGPLISLLQYLLRAAGEERLPLNTTLHHDLVTLYTGKERHGRPDPKRR